MCYQNKKKKMAGDLQNVIVKQNEIMKNVINEDDLLLNKNKVDYLFLI